MENENLIVNGAMSLEDWMENLSLEVDNVEGDNFKMLIETLSRIGVSAKDKLYQSCHILHKREKYYIVHFKEMFLLDGKEVKISEDDMIRRARIALLLEEWKLLRIVRPTTEELREKIENYRGGNFKVLKHGDPTERVAKYTIGLRNKRF